MKIVILKLWITF